MRRRLSKVGKETCKCEAVRVVSASTPEVTLPLSFAVHESGDLHVSERLATSGEWEPFETEIIRRLLTAGPRSPSTLIDAGANIGWHSVVAAKHGATVQSFEPYPPNVALLRSNIERNGVGGRVVAHPVALGDVPGAVRLHVSATNQGDHRLHVGSASDPQRERPFVIVEQTTLDLVLPSFRPSVSTLGRIVVKLDTQGSETSILRGARSLWDPQRGVNTTSIVTEFWPYGLDRCGSSGAELVSLLSPLLTSHRCFHLMENERRLVELDAEHLARLANSVGLSLDVRGFTSLVLVPLDQVRCLVDLVATWSSVLRS